MNWSSDQGLLHSAGGFLAALAPHGSAARVSRGKTLCIRCGSQPRFARSKLSGASHGSQPHSSRFLTIRRASASSCGPLRAMQSSKLSPTCERMCTMRHVVS